MDIVKKGNKLVVAHILKRGETYKVSEGRTFKTISIYSKPQICKGMSSYCGDGLHCLFIDYDDCPLYIVKQDYSLLQRLYGLPKGILVTTGYRTEDGEDFGNWHVICLVKFYPKQIYEMLSKTHSDVNFMSSPLRNKYSCWILRVGPKKKKDRPQFVEFIGKDIKSKLETSTAHLEFLKKLYPKIKHIDLDNQDGLKKIFLQEYQAT